MLGGQFEDTLHAFCFLLLTSAVLDGMLTCLRSSQVNVAAPAGAIVSTARDMSRWMMWHLSGGAVPPTAADSTRPAPPPRHLIDKDGLWETYRGRNHAFSRNSNDELAAMTNASDEHDSYDLGWITSYYRGNNTSNRLEGTHRVRTHAVLLLTLTLTLTFDLST